MIGQRRIRLVEAARLHIQRHCRAAIVGNQVVLDVDQLQAIGADAAAVADDHVVANHWCVVSGLPILPQEDGCAAVVLDHVAEDAG